MDINLKSHRASHKKVSILKKPEHEGEHGFWFKKSRPSVTDRFLNWVDTKKKREDTNEWLSRKIHKGNTTSNYRPIWCLTMMRKMITSQLGRSIICFNAEECFWREKKTEWMIWHGLGAEKPSICSRKLSQNTETERRLEVFRIWWSINEINLNTEKCSGDLRRHLVTQAPAEDHHLTLV